VYIILFAKAISDNLQSAYFTSSGYTDSSTDFENWEFQTYMAAEREQLICGPLTVSVSHQHMDILMPLAAETPDIFISLGCFPCTQFSKLF